MNQLRLFLICCALVSSALTQDYVAFPSSITGPGNNTPGNAIPFGPQGVPGYTFVMRFRASELSGRAPIIEDIGLWGLLPGNWSSSTVKMGFGHVPSPLPCPFAFPGAVGSSALGSFLDLTVFWDSNTDGPFSFSWSGDQWSDLGSLAQGRTPFTWNGVDDVGFFISFQAATQTNGQSFAADGLAPPRTYTSAYAAATSQNPMTCDERAGLWSRLRVTCPSPEFQTNSPTSYLDIDGLVNTPCGPIIARGCQGLSNTLNLQSTAIGLPWDIGLHLGSTVPLSSSGIATPNGQIVNLNLSSASLGWINGLSFTNAFPGPVSGPIIGTSPGRLSLQMINLSPGEADGFALSAPGEFRFAAQGLTALSLGNDDWIEIPLGSAPVCTAPITFYGTTYTTLYVCSNGLVSFEAGQELFVSNPQEFVDDMPAIAGLWSDLDPLQGGIIGVAGTSTTLQVSFANVPEIDDNSIPTGAFASFDVFFDSPAGSLEIRGYAADPNHLGSALVGISPGRSLSPGLALTFSAFAGLPVQALPNPTNAIYEFLSGSAPQGYTRILFPNSDGSAFQVF